MTRWLTLQASGGQSVLKYSSLLPPARSVSPTAPAASPSSPCHQGLFFPAEAIKSTLSRVYNWDTEPRAGVCQVPELRNYEVEAGFTKVCRSTESWHQSECELKAPQPHGPGERNFSQSLHSFWFFWGSVLLPSLGPWKYPVSFQKSLLFLIKLIWVVAVPWKQLFFVEDKRFLTPKTHEDP